MPVAVLASLAAGACFALAGVLQQRAASARPAEEALSWTLLSHLVRRPLWLSGIAFAFLAYGFQALALAHAPLSLVQPLIVCELIFAVPLSARLSRMRLGVREWIGTLSVAAGLALALSTARPHGGSSTGADLGPWLMTLGSVCGVTLCALVARRFVSGTWRASLVALAGGAVMGFQSVLLTITVAHMERGLLALFTAWQTYLLVIASFAGLLLIQSAFQAGPLAATMTVIDATEPAVAIATGTTLFGESLHHGWPTSVFTVLGVCLTVFGIVRLNSSPLIAALHPREPHGLPAADGPGCGRAAAERTRDLRS